MAATGGQTRHQKGAEGSQARLAQPWAGASPAQQERWEMRFGPQNHAGSQGKGGGVEEALGPGAQGWGNEPRWPWNVSGPCERFLVPSLCQVGQEGTGVLLWFGLSRTQRSQCWMQPRPRAQGGPSSTCSQPGLAPAPGYSHGGSMPGVPNQALALFSTVVLLCEMQGPGGMRMRRGRGCSSLPAPCQRQEGELELLSQDGDSSLGRWQGWLRAAPGPSQPLATAQFLLKPVGFCSCHRHRSSHILSRPKAAFQPSSRSASAGSA